MPLTKVVDTLLPRAHWFREQLDGRDVRVAFENVDHHEAYEDATAAAISDQEEAGLDIVTDGQMSYDDYVGVIGSFCWYMYVGDVIAQCVDGVDARIGWHFCFGNAWGNALSGIFPTGYQTVLPHFYDVPIDEFVLDFANREMVDVDLLKGLPQDKDVQIGVLDIRTMQIESPEQVADRIRKVINVISPERVTLSTDCGMKPLPRIVAKMKLKALAEGAPIVRAEIS